MSIAYKNGGSPKIQVLTPNLFELAHGKEPPHLYPPMRHPASLCLFHPDRYEWTRQMRIVDTIVPWTAEWLFHYELWLGTGEWHGGGEHPESGRSRGYSRRLSERWLRQRPMTSSGAVA
ncbi:MAG: hypothetical protein QM741_14940 [Rudaea sp.]|uniref:hypothetical protein n=1 Tax=Rudaea sp. TaxID=2136325 RepID=UPI0039E248B4